MRGFKIWGPVVLAGIIFLVCGYLAIGTPHSFLLLIPCVLNLLLAHFVYLKKPDNHINRTFALFCSAIASYNLAVFGLAIAPDEQFADYWTRIFNVGAIFAPAFVMMFVRYLVQVNSRLIRTVIVVSNIVAVSFYMASLGGHFTDGFTKMDLKFAPHPTVVYKLYLVYVTVSASFALYYLFVRYYSTTSYRERNQYKYFFWAIAILIVLAMTNILLTFGRHVYSLSGIGSLAFSLLIAYSILKYQALDIQVIVRKSLVYASLTLLIAGCYALLVGILNALLGISNVMIQGNWFINGLSGAAIAAAFFPLRNRIQYGIDRLFFREKYDYRQTLKELSEHLSSLIELDQLCELLVSRIMDTMHIDRGSIMVLSSDRNIYEVRYSRGMEKGYDDYALDDTGILMRQLRGTRPVFINEMMPETYLQNQGIILCMPLSVRGQLVGILNLGQKQSEEMYSGIDIELLVTLANQAAVAIANARLSEQMRLLEKSVYHADKMSALGTFASSIAHEIKNPLASIKTFSQLVARRFNDARFIDKFNAIVPAEIERMEGVLGQLLDFGKTSEIVMSAIRIEKVINDLMILVQYEASRNRVRITQRYVEDLPSVVASEEQLKQVFMNLILNAIQAMPEGGDISITGRIEEKAEKSMVCIAIADTGCGITDEAIKKIFTPFYTTKLNGTGLGLSITNKIIREHGGSVEVKSVLNKGTVFSIYLPYPVENSAHFPVV